MGNSSPPKRYNAAVLGAAGGIGQPLSLLLAQSPYVKKLNCYDVVPVVNGVGVDLAHICTDCQVIGFAGDLKDAEASKKTLSEALNGIDICVIPAGVPRKPGMTRDQLFDINAGIVAGLVEGIAKTCPKAMICIISNPVNSTVPIAAEVLKKHGVYDEKRLFGVSTLDIVRSQKFIGVAKGIDPQNVNVTCIGGHSGVTILPLLSQVQPKVNFSNEEIAALTKRIQSAGTEVVEAKAGGGSATLSMAYAGARFAEAVLKGMSGESNVIECAYVSSKLTSMPFFASKVLLGKEGCENVISFGTLSPFEQEKLEKEVFPDLEKNIAKGIAFAKAL